jgi:hypothetical protein
VERSPQSLNLLPLARNSTTSTHTAYSVTSRAQFRAPELHSAAAVFLRSGRALHARGQHHSSSPEPPQHHKQHHIITLKLFDLSIGSLVHYRASPTLAGVLPRRRRIGLRRSPSIQHVFIQLMAPTHSPCLTEAFAQVGCQRSPPELCRRR